MSSRVDYSALLMYRATEESGASGITDRYFVPLAAIDEFDVRQRSAPLSWSARPGSTEMRLQRYTVPFILTGTADPDIDTVLPGTEGNSEIEIFVENLTDISITVGYNIPTNLLPFAEVESGDFTVSSPGASGSIVVGPLATGSFTFGVTFSTPVDPGLIEAMVFPGSLFTYNGEPWEADVTIPVTWASEIF